jgi:folate-binding protein YgfZ
MSQIQLPDPTSWAGALLLSDLGVIEANGPDAATFLHGQLSQDMTGQPPHEARLAAYCSAKGRMLGSFVTLRPQAEQFCLITARNNLPALHKRLSMFVMRSKLKLSDASDTLVVLGLISQSVGKTLGDAAQAMSPWSVQAHADGWLLRLPDVLGVPRWQWVGPQASATTVLSQVPALPAEQWAWLDVMSGVPAIEAATVDQFVPQMINFELIGGVNFKKGCYPGQEIVARSQYRGTLKRRAFVVHADQPLAPAQEIFSAADPGQPAGMVIQAASQPGQGSACSALIELKLAATDQALFGGSPDGTRLSLGTLPYALPVDGTQA